MREPAKYRARNAKSLIYYLPRAFRTIYQLLHARIACYTPLGRHAFAPTYAPSDTTWASRGAGEPSLASSDHEKRILRVLTTWNDRKAAGGGLFPGTITVRNVYLTVFYTLLTYACHLNVLC